MEKEKPRGTRPEMGTPEYEEWRKRMIARRRKRLQRERRKRLIAMGVALVVVIGGISAGINSCNGKNLPYPGRITLLPVRKQKTELQRRRTPQKIRQIPKKIQQQKISLRRQISLHSSIITMKRFLF